MACGSKGTSFVTAAFKSCKENEAYIFLKDTYVVDNYCPTSDKILCGPTIISQGFPCLKDTAIGDNGVDCAFASHDAGKAYLFSGNVCALLEYSPCGPKNAKLVKGPKPIVEMFPFLKCTVFETGVDAAFESSIKHEAYLFKGDHYALITYDGCNPGLKFQAPIAKVWHCLKGTVFERNIGGAFASHRHNDAYLFKGEYYVHLKFTPHEEKDKIVGGVRKIKDYWPELSALLPQPNTCCN